MSTKPSPPEFDLAASLKLARRMIIEKAVHYSSMLTYDEKARQHKTVLAILMVEASTPRNNPDKPFALKPAVLHQLFLVIDVDKNESFAFVEERAMKAYVKHRANKFRKKFTKYVPGAVATASDDYRPRALSDFMRYAQSTTTDEDRDLVRSSFDDDNLTSN